MSHISSTPRRPSTAQSASLTTRMPYDAGEALLWERQNHRVHAHLSVQMKELQAQHNVYDARIQAAESVAEAAESAIHKVKQMEAKIAAMEADDQDRPFDAWAKEAISQVQVFVDSHKGVRQKLSGLEQKTSNLGENVESLMGVSALLKSMVRRLEVLEDERMGQSQKVKDMEAEVARLRSTSQRQNSVPGEVQPDDNPLHVFYGIDAQAHVRHRSHPPKDTHERDSRPQELAESPLQRHNLRDSETLPVSHEVQPPNKDTAQPAEGNFDVLETAPEIECGWESTQQFKDMQKELVALRAMCRTEEPKSSGQTADATQGLQETIVLPRDNELAFSDATTVSEVEDNDLARCRNRHGAHHSLGHEPSSDIHLPSSPPKRHSTQSARYNIMKRPSIYDPRVPPMNEHRQDQRPDSMAEPGEQVRPSLIVKLPFRAQIFNNRVSAKRKRVEDAPTQRVKRPKLTDDRTAAREPAAPTTRNNRLDNGNAVMVPDLSAVSGDAPALVSPTGKSHSKQKPAINAPVDHEASRDGPSGPNQLVAPASKPTTVQVAKTGVPQKAAGRRKPAARPPIQEQVSPQAGSSSSKKTNANTKKESKRGRQPQGACKSCRTRHQKCDRTHPACGRCAKVGSSCEYQKSTKATVPPSVPHASGPRRKQALPPIQAAAKDTNDQQNQREESVNVIPEASRQNSPVKRQLLDSPLKKTIAAATPTAASTRAPRAKHAPNSRTSPQKQK